MANNKRKFIQRPNPNQLDLKSLFLEHSKEHYIPHLKSSNNQKLKDILENITDEDEAIQSFVNDNICRVYLLLHRHHNPDFHEELKVVNWDSSNPYAGTYIKYHEEPATVQNQYLLEYYRMYILKFCFQNDLLLCDGIYISPNAINTYSTKCYGYKLHPRMYDIDWVKFRLECRATIINNFENPKKTYRHKEYTPTSERIMKMSKEFNLDVDSIDGYKKEIEKYQNLKNRQWSKVDSYGRRVYTPESIMDGDLRKHLYINSKDEKYGNADISNSTHYLFANMMLDSLNLSDYAIDQLDKMAKAMKGEKLFEGEIIHVLTCLLKPVYHDFNFNEVWDELSEYIFIEDLNRKLLNKLFSTPKRKRRDRLNYALLSASGLLYEVLIAKFQCDKDRDEIKELLSTLLNCKISYMHADNGVFENFKKYFPTIFNRIIDRKRNGYKNLGFQITKRETAFMIENISKQLLDEGKRFVFLYDGIIIEESQVEDVADRIRTQSKKMLTLTAPVSIEKYHKKPDIIDKAQEILMSI